MKISDTPLFKTTPIPYFTTPTFLWEKSEHPRFKKFFRAQTSPPPICKGRSNYELWKQHFGAVPNLHVHYLKGQEPIQTCKEILQYKIAVHLINVCSCV